MAYRELADYVMDQLGGLDARCLPMMGGWLFYIEGKVFGGIYDEGRVMVKITDASRRALPDAAPEPPYEGAKVMLPALNLDDREAFREMVTAMAGELPAPKPRKERKKRGV